MIKVIDNCLNEEVFKDLCVIAQDVPYQFQANTAYDNAEDASSFNCLYTIKELAKENGKIIEEDPLGMAVSTIIKNAVLQANMPFNGIGRIRFAILHKTNKNTNAPHIDYHLKHKVGLIYLNNSDGETVLYNEKINWENLHNPDNLMEYFKQPVTIDKKIKPKTNRMILFDGNQLHSSTNPSKSDYRMVLNFNYV